MKFIHFGINVPVDHHQVRPAAIVEIEKHRTPTEILHVLAQAGATGHVGELPVAVVAIQRRRILREIRFEDIRPPVTVVIAHRRAHAGLLAPIFVKRDARGQRFVGKRAVAIVVIQNARLAVAGHEHIRPAVVVIVEGGHAEAEFSVGSVDMRGLADVPEFPAAQILVQNIFRAFQTPRSAHHRRAFPHAIRSRTRRLRRGRFEIHVVRHHQVEFSVAVVIDERAARAPRLAGSGHARPGADLRKFSVIVVVQPVLTVVRHVQVFPAVVVVIAHAHALAPTARREPSLHRHVGERAVMIVVVQMIGRRLSRRKSFQRRTVDQKNIRPPVVVIVKNRHARASRFDDEFLGVDPSKNVLHVQPGFFSDIREIRQRLCRHLGPSRRFLRRSFFRGIRRRLRRRTPGKGAGHQQQNQHRPASAGPAPKRKNPSQTHSLAANRA